jgi:hypothetical protein
MTPELMTAILAALGLPVILPKMIDGWGAWRSGRAMEEKETNKSLQVALEAEMSYRRIVEESLSSHRRILIEVYGVPVDRLPPWPVRPGRTKK